MMFLCYLAVCLFVTAAKALKCDLCSEDCGEAGFFDCATCSCAPSCDAFPCATPRECVLESVPCISDPCPKMPMCVDFTTVCSSPPLQIEGSALLCDDQVVTCPLKYACTPVAGHSISVCCKETKQDLLPPTSRVIVSPPSFSSGSHDNDDEDDDCWECPFDPCEMTSCLAHPTAQCVTDDCVCESWYIDHEANPVDCHEGMNIPDSMDPFFGGDDGTVEIPPITSPPSSLEKTPSLISKMTTTTRPVDSASPLGVHDHDEDDVVIGDVIVHVAIATCCVLVALVIVIVSCRIYFKKTRLRNQRHKEEQLEPLRDANGNKPELP